MKPNILSKAGVAILLSILNFLNGISLNISLPSYSCPIMIGMTNTTLLCSIPSLPDFLYLYETQNTTSTTNYSLQVIQNSKVCNYSSQNFFMNSQGDFLCIETDKKEKLNSLRNVSLANDSVLSNFSFPIYKMNSQIKDNLLMMNFNGNNTAIGEMISLLNASIKECVFNFSSDVLTNFNQVQNIFYNQTTKNLRFIFTQYHENSFAAIDYNCTSQMIRNAQNYTLDNPLQFLNFNQDDEDLLMVVYESGWFNYTYSILKDFGNNSSLDVLDYFEDTIIEVIWINQSDYLLAIGNRPEYPSLIMLQYYRLEDYMPKFVRSVQYPFEYDSAAVIDEEYVRFTLTPNNNFLCAFTVALTDLSITDITSGDHIPQMSNGSYLISTSDNTFTLTIGTVSPQTLECITMNDIYSVYPYEDYWFACYSKPLLYHVNVAKSEVTSINVSECNQTYFTEVLAARNKASGLEFAVSGSEGICVYQNGSYTTVQESDVVFLFNEQNYTYISNEGNYKLSEDLYAHIDFYSYEISIHSASLNETTQKIQVIMSGAMSGVILNIKALSIDPVSGTVLGWLLIGDTTSCILDINGTLHQIQGNYFTPIQITNISSNGTLMTQLTVNNNYYIEQIVVSDWGTGLNSNSEGGNEILWIILGALGGLVLAGGIGFWVRKKRSVKKVVMNDDDLLKDDYLVN